MWIKNLYRFHKDVSLCSFPIRWPL